MRAFLFAGVHLGLLGFSMTLCGIYGARGFPLAPLLESNQLAGPLRAAMFHQVLLGAAAAIVAGWGLYGVLRIRQPTPRRALVAFHKVLRVVRPFETLFLLVLLWDRKAWLLDPLFSFGLALGTVAVFTSSLLETVRIVSQQWPCPGRLPDRSAARIAWVGLIAACIGYASFCSYYTIFRHKSLMTSAYDLGIFENTYFNTIHGRVMQSSMEGGIHFRRHPSFILFLLVPVYWLFPRPETLLVCQSVLLGLGAIPLFLLALHELKRPFMALLIAILYLIHPALSGANFYDFHELAFTPFLLFSAFLCLRQRHLGLLTFFLVLLLTVKEDMSLVVFCLGAFLVLEDQPRIGAILTALGILSYWLLQGLLVPYFYQGGLTHSYAHYYGAMIPQDEGPFGLVKTILINPLFSLRYAVDAKKVLYVLQILTPVALIPFFSVNNLVFMAYCLVCATASTHSSLFELGFQYSLTFLSVAFVITVIELARRPASGRGLWTQPGLITLCSLLSVLVTYHHGPFISGHNFKGGFSTMSFDDSEGKQRLRDEVASFIRLIPDDASVTASETLVPQVAGRRDVQTLRLAPPGMDYYFLWKVDTKNAQYKRDHASAFDRRDYVLIKESRHLVLLKRKDAPAGNRSG